MEGTERAPAGDNGNAAAALMEADDFTDVRTDSGVDASAAVVEEEDEEDEDEGDDRDEEAAACVGVVVTTER